MSHLKRYWTNIQWFYCGYYAHQKRLSKEKDQLSVFKTEGNGCEGGEKTIKKKKRIEKNQIQIIMIHSLVHKFRNEQKEKRG